MEHPSFEYLPADLAEFISQQISDITMSLMKEETGDFTPPLSPVFPTISDGFPVTDDLDADDEGKYLLTFTDDGTGGKKKKRYIWFNEYPLKGTSDAVILSSPHPTRTKDAASLFVVDCLTPDAVRACDKEVVPVLKTLFTTQTGHAKDIPVAYAVTQSVYRFYLPETFPLFTQVYGKVIGTSRYDENALDIVSAEEDWNSLRDKFGIPLEYTDFKKKNMFENLSTVSCKLGKMLLQKMRNDSKDPEKMKKMMSQGYYKGKNVKSMKKKFLAMLKSDMDENKPVSFMSGDMKWLKVKNPAITITNCFRFENAQMSNVKKLVDIKKQDYIYLKKLVFGIQLCYFNGSWKVSFVEKQPSNRSVDMHESNCILFSYAKTASSGEGGTRVRKRRKLMI